MAATICWNVAVSIGREKSTPLTSARNDGPAGTQLKGMQVQPETSSASDQACSSPREAVKARTPMRSMLRVYFLLRAELRYLSDAQANAQGGVVARSSGRASNA